MADESLKRQTKKGLYWKFAEQFSNYGVQFIIGIFMARLLSPSDYGITALPTVFMALAGTFISGGFGDALVRKLDLKDEDLSTAFYYSLGLGIIFYFILFFLSPYIADFYETPVLKPLMRVTALSFIYGSIDTPQVIILKRRLDFKTFAKISVVCKILMGVIGVSMAYFGYGVWALVISSMASGLLGQLANLYVVRWIPKTGWSKESFKYLWNYGNKIMVSAVLDTIYANITPIIVGKYYSTAQLGVYNRAKGYADMPSLNVYACIRDVSFPVLSKLQNDPGKLIASYRRMISLSAFVIFPMMMMLAALARPLIIVMITEKWEACIILLQLICFSAMWLPIHAINMTLLRIQGRSDLLLKLEIAKKIVGLTIMCVFLPLGLVAFCAAQIGAAFISLFINTWYTGKFFNFGFLMQLKDLLPIILLCSFMYIAVVLLNLYITNLILQIVVGSVVGSGIYIGGAFFFHFKEINDVKYMLNRRT